MEKDSVLINALILPPPYSTARTLAEATRSSERGPVEEFIEPGKPDEFTIQMHPAGLVFQRGHRIRLDVSSSNFPRFNVNPNTGEPLNDNRRTQVATNTIYTDAAHPSRILLPVIPSMTPSHFQEISVGRV